MKQLDPKAAWLFFINSVSAFIFFSIIVIFVSWLMATIPVPEDSEAINFVGEFFLAILRPFYASPMRVLAILIIFFITALITSKLAYHFYGYELSDKGLKKESGIISKRYSIVTYDRIQNIGIERDLVHRILGLSTLKVDTAGTGYAEFILPGLSDSDARQLREEILIRMKEVRKVDQGL